MDQRPIDSYGMPCTKQYDGSLDGGDTAAILGTLIALGKDEYNGLSLILSKWKNPVRHPDISKWYGQPDRFSRDQLIPLICSAIRFGHSVYFQWLFGQHRNKLFLFAWNTRGNGAMEKPWKLPDLCGPSVWALWIRYYKPWWAHLALCTLDLELLVGACLWKWFQPKTNRVTRNFMLMSISCRRTMPTLVSRLVFWMNDWRDLISRWDAHCQTVGEYQTADLFRKAIEEKP